MQSNYAAKSGPDVVVTPVKTHAAVTVGEPLFFDATSGAFDGKTTKAASTTNRVFPAGVARATTTEAKPILAQVYGYHSALRARGSAIAIGTVLMGTTGADYLAATASASLAAIAGIVAVAASSWTQSSTTGTVAGLVKVI